MSISQNIRKMEKNDSVRQCFYLQICVLTTAPSVISNVCVAIANGISMISALISLACLEIIYMWSEAALLPIEPCKAHMGYKVNSNGQGTICLTKWRDETFQSRQDHCDSAWEHLVVFSGRIYCCPRKGKFHTKVSVTC